jgi:hypothetical protein
MSFNEIVLNLKAQKEDILQLKNNILGVPIERSIDNILNRIYDDLKRLLN